MKRVIILSKISVTHVIDNCPKTEESKELFTWLLIFFQTSVIFNDYISMTDVMQY